MLRRVVLASCAVIVVGLVHGPSAAQKRFITETDLLKFTWIADPQLSPDGATIAFVRVTVNEKEDRYETSLFAVSTEVSPSSSVSSSGSSATQSSAAASQSSGQSNTIRQLTSNIRDTAPRWSPDGRRLAFVRSVEKDGRRQPGQLYVLPMNGGEAYPLTDVPEGISSPSWSPDGKTIAFNSTALPGEAKKGSAFALRDQITLRRDGAREESTENTTRSNGRDGTSKSDVKVITRATYRANGHPSYVDPERRAHIWTVAVAEAAAELPEPKQITRGDFDEEHLEWSRDGSAIYFTSDRVAEPEYLPFDSDLYSVSAAGGPITKIASIDGEIDQIAVSPDGKRIAFIGVLHGDPIRSHSQPDLFVVDTKPGSTPRNLTASYDFGIGDGIGGDQAAPRGGRSVPIVWSRDASSGSESLIVVSAEHGSADLKRVSIATGKVEPVTEGAQTVMSYAATPDASKIAAIVSTQTNIGDLVLVTAPADGHQAVARQITRVNEALLGEITQSEPEEFWYTSFDGKRIQGWILKPPDFDRSRKYPMILEIHGGPHSAYGNVYTHEFMWMAAKGYVVVFTNPRGSTTYGQDFGNIIQFHYPGDDYKDLMAGVDEVLKRGYVDASRLGVTGGSGGGLLTNWTITQTGRFKAAIAQRDIADWYGFWFTADFSQFQPGWFRKAPWEDPQDYAARSPITHVANVTTPLMLILGDADYRTPPGNGGEMMFRALKYRKVPTVMVRFPRENHELSRSGEPHHRIERLQHIVGWMDQWLKGKKSDIYTAPLIH